MPNIMPPKTSKRIALFGLIYFVVILGRKLPKPHRTNAPKAGKIHSFIGISLPHNQNLRFYPQHFVVGLFLVFMFFIICCIFSTNPIYCTTILNFQMRSFKNFTIISGLVWHNHHHMILIFISLAIPKQALITSVLKITLKNWSRYTLKGRNWDDMYKSRYGYWRTYVMTVIYKYLDCGDLHFGFARVKCEDCGHEYLLAFSCYSYCTSFASPDTFVDKRRLADIFLPVFCLNLKQILPGSSNKYWL